MQLQYGSAPKPFASMNQTNEFFVNKGERKRLNIVAILISLFAPWCLFCFVFACLSFSVHYYQPYIAYGLVTIAFLGGVMLPALLATKAMKRKITDPASYQPSWFIFLFGTCLLAFVVGAMMGADNYSNNSYKYYSLTHLAHYSDVDTSTYLGQQLMDAGRLDFKKGTALAIDLSMGFKNHDMYCVAPIVTKGKDKPLSYDFWAVGKGCCSGSQADFHCTGFNDRIASSSIRLMHDEDRPFYRLAVQQAEAMYKVTATHPLFFEWVHDGDEAVNSYAQKGYTNYLLGIFSYFLFQSFLVVCTSLVFAKFMHYPAGNLGGGFAH